MWLHRKEAYPNFRSMTWIGILLFTGGTEDLSIVFNSTSSENVNRFPETRVTDSPWTDLNNEPRHLISIKGCCTKRDCIVRNHGGCSEDAGWLATASINCDWEGKYTASNTLYSKLTTYNSFSRTGKGKWRELVIVNLPLENIHFEIAADPCNLSGSLWCIKFTKRTIFCSKSVVSFFQPMRTICLKRTPRFQALFKVTN